MKSTIRYVGLDVHKDTVTIAVARGEGDPEIVVTGLPTEAMRHIPLWSPEGPSHAHTHFSDSMS